MLKPEFYKCENVDERYVKLQIRARCKNIHEAEGTQNCEREDEIGVLSEITPSPLSFLCLSITVKEVYCV